MEFVEIIPSSFEEIVVKIEEKLDEKGNIYCVVSTPSTKLDNAIYRIARKKDYSVGKGSRISIYSSGDVTLETALEIVKEAERLINNLRKAEITVRIKKDE